MTDEEKAAAAAEAARKAAEEAARKAAEEAARMAYCGLDSGCSGHGSCNETEKACECDEWWDGEFCETQHCKGFNKTTGTDDCHGNGMCLKGKCYCSKGFGLAEGKEGENVCEDRVCPHDCGSHGHCEGSDCVCDEGWQGPLCREPECVDACSGHGVCAFWSGPNSPGECKCVEGWSGAACKT